jgi:hypothetical protein
MEDNYLLAFSMNSWKFQFFPSLPYFLDFVLEGNATFPMAVPKDWPLPCDL